MAPYWDQCDSTNPSRALPLLMNKYNKHNKKTYFCIFVSFFSGGGTSNSADGKQTRVNSPYTIEQMQRNGSLTNRKMSVQVGAWWMNFFSQNFNGIPVGKTDGFSNWISINVIFCFELPKSLFANFWGLTVQKYHKSLTRKLIIEKISLKLHNLTYLMDRVDICIWVKFCSFYF